MEITTRALWTLIHGMGFGALYLLACSGALVELYRFLFPGRNVAPAGGERCLKIYLVAMAVIAWAAVLTGAYMIYPWYRAIPPAGTASLAMYPQKFLEANAATSGWHSLGMEWKEHVAWFAPISITMAAFVVIRFGADLNNHKQLRAAVMAFVVTSFVAAGVAGFFGAMINKAAPVEGGPTIHISQGESK
jgi:hypothetical protein